MSNGHRWSKFYWADWANDPALRTCSLAAQGLWMRMLCLMHDAEPAGYLLVNGVAPDTKELADILGNAKSKQVSHLLDELSRRKVFSKDDLGVIYCRRMVRDVAASKAGREYVARRWNGEDNSPPPNTTPIREPNTSPNRANASTPNREPNSEPITEKQSTEAEAEVGGFAPSPRAQAHAHVRETPTEKGKNLRKKKELKWNLLPENWQPAPQHFDLGQTLGFDEHRVRYEAGEMRAYAEKERVTYRDWDWRFGQWMQKAKFIQQNSQKQTTKSTHQQIREAAGLGTFLAGAPYEETLPQDDPLGVRLTAIAGGKS